MALIRLRPEEYANELGLRMSSDIISTSSRWLTSIRHANRWIEINFADTLWTPAVEEGTTTQFGPHVARAIWFEHDDNHVGADSVQSHKNVPVTNENPVRPDRVFFRKTFNVEGLPVSGIVRLFVDDSYDLFFNGEYIAKHKFDPNQQTDTFVHDVSDYLRSGKNAIAIEVFDSDQSGGRLAAVFQLKNLPNWSQVGKNAEPKLQNTNSEHIADEQGNN